MTFIVFWITTQSVETSQSVYFISETNFTGNYFFLYWNNDIFYNSKKIESDVMYKRLPKFSSVLKIRKIIN